MRARAENIQFLQDPADTAGIDLALRRDPCSDRHPYSARTLLGALYDSCFGPAATFDRGGTAGFLLYLDTYNLPSRNGGVRKLILSSLPTAPGAGLDQIDLFFTGGLPAEIDPGILDEHGWKLRLEGADVVLCTSCVDLCGQVPILLLRGGLDRAEFVRDPADSLDAHLRFVPGSRLAQDP